MKAQSLKAKTNQFGFRRSLFWMCLRGETGTCLTLVTVASTISQPHLNRFQIQFDRLGGRAFSLNLANLSQIELWLLASWFTICSWRLDNTEIGLGTNISAGRGRRKFWGVFAQSLMFLFTQVVILRWKMHQVNFKFFWTKSWAKEYSCKNLNYTFT